MTAYEGYNPNGYTRPEIPDTDWLRISVLQTERAHIGREIVKSGNHSHTTPTPDVKRWNVLNNAIREAMNID